MLWKNVIILFGILLLCMDFWSLICKKFTELMGIGWGIFSILIIVSGAISGFSDWGSFREQREYLMFFLFFAAIVIGFFFVCRMLSQLTMKNQELAMQVSLLNQENESILKELELLTGKSKNIDKER